LREAFPRFNIEKQFERDVTCPFRTPPLPEAMILRTVEQVRRLSRIVGGFTLLLIGIVMIVTPGPGWLVILLGLGLLAAEFVWARRLMDRIKRESDRVRNVVWRVTGNVPNKNPTESNQTTELSNTELSN
jgi:hypothetical protein